MIATYNGVVGRAKPVSIYTPYNGTGVLTSGGASLAGAAAVALATGPGGIAAGIGGAIAGVAGRMDTAEGKITALEGKAHEHANKDVIDAITAEKVSAWDAAEGNAKTYADGLNTAMGARVEAVEGKAHEHSNKDILDGITSAKVSAWDAAEGNAKAYAKEYADSLAGNYDNKGAAASALTDAKTYADGLNAAMNIRVAAIEADYMTSANIASNAEVTAALDGVFGA